MECVIVDYIVVVIVEIEYGCEVQVDIVCVQFGGQYVVVSCGSVCGGQYVCVLEFVQCVYGGQVCKVVGFGVLYVFVFVVDVNEYVVLNCVNGLCQCG